MGYTSMSYRANHLLCCLPESRKAFTSIIYFEDKNKTVDLFWSFLLQLGTFRAELRRLQNNVWVTRFLLAYQETIENNIVNDIDFK